MPSIIGFSTRFNVYYGWVIVAATAAILFMAYGVQYSSGIFLSAIEQDLGWSRSEISLAFTLYAVTYTSMSAVTGRITDRSGPRGVVLIGGILLAIGMALFSQAQYQWQVYICYGIIAGLGMSAAYVPCTTTVLRWFMNRRGTALSLTTMGSSVGILLIPMVSGILVAHWGWRSGYLILSIALMIVIFTASRLLQSNPVTSDITQHSTSSKNEPQDLALSLSQASKTRNFWFYSSGIILAKSVGIIPFIHLPSMIIIDQGNTAIQGSLAPSLIGTGALLGVLLSGPISDRIGVVKASVAMVMIETLAYLGWLTMPSQALPFSFVFGMFYGSSLVLMPAMAAELFGKANVGSIFGTIFGGIGIAGALGVFLAGIAYDTLGSYESVFRIAIILCVASLILFTMVRIPNGTQSIESTPSTSPPGRLG